MAAISTILMGAGVGLSAYGAYKQSKAEKSRTEQEAVFREQDAELAERNAEIAAENAGDVRKEGRGAMYDQRKALAAALGDQRAATAGAGIVLDEPGTTAAALTQAMVIAGEIDIMRIKQNIESEARRAEVQGENFTRQAGALRQNAGALRTQARSINPFFSGVTAGVQGFSSSSDLMDLIA